MAEDRDVTNCSDGQSRYLAESQNFRRSGGSSLHVLVLGGRRALLKLCFQVFIVLSPADEAGTCRVYEGVGRCGVAALRVSRVRLFLVDVHGLSYRVTRTRSLLSCSNRLVASVK
jgi:hypothetical protein